MSYSDSDNYFMGKGFRAVTFILTLKSLEKIKKVVKLSESRGLRVRTNENSSCGTS